MICKDQLNRTLTLSHTPKRIISLVPSQTELLVDLGLEESIVGITRFCVHPKNLKKSKTIVGGTKKIRVDKIKALHPDIIICNKEENSKEIVESLEKIAPVWVSDMYTIEDALQMISLLGTLFNVEDRSRKIINSINSETNEFVSFMKLKPYKKVAYLIWNNPYMLAGRNTFIQQLLALNKFENIITDPNSRYPEATIEDLKKTDIILLSSEPFPFKEKHLIEIKETTQKEVILVDGEYFSWYGSRLEHAFSYFKRLH